MQAATDQDSRDIRAARRTINVRDPDALHKWAREYGVQEATLVRVIAEVGNSPKAVRAHLRRRGR